jgi:hypothetical protein
MTKKRQLKQNCKINCQPAQAILFGVICVCLLYCNKDAKLHNYQGLCAISLKCLYWVFFFAHEAD